MTVSVPELSQPPQLIPEGEPLKVRFPDPVLLPTSPIRVTIGLPAAAVDDDLHVESNGTFELSCTVIVLLLQGHGVLWLAVATPQTSGVIIRGEAILQMPAFVLRLLAVIYGDASTDTLAAPCAVCPLVSVNANTYAAPATNVGDCTVTTSDPTFSHEPLDASDVFMVTMGSVLLSGVVEPTRPVKVTLAGTVLHVGNKGTLLVKVTVSVFEAHGYVEL